MLRGLKKVKQRFVLTVAAYNLTRMRSLDQLPPEVAQEGRNSGNHLVQAPHPPLRPAIERRFALW